MPRYADDIKIKQKSDKRSDMEIIILMVIPLDLGFIQVVLGLIRVLR